MSIIDCLISRKCEIVLVEYTEHHGNFQQIARVLLRKLSKETKLTIDYNNFQFHYLKNQEIGVEILCLTENLSFEYAFGFMVDCLKHLQSTYDIRTIQSAFSYELQEFEEVIKDLVIYYSSKPSITKYVGEFSSLGIRNVELKKIESIFSGEEKTEMFAINSKIVIKNYQTANPMARKIEYQEKYKKIKMTLLISLGVVIFLCSVKYIISS